MLTFLGPLLLLAALYGVGSQASEKLGAIYRMPVGLVYGLAGGAFLAGLISRIREADRSWRRPVSVVVALLSVVVAGATLWVTNRAKPTDTKSDAASSEAAAVSTSSPAEAVSPQATAVPAGAPESAVPPAEKAPATPASDPAVPTSPASGGQGNASEN